MRFMFLIRPVTPMAPTPALMAAMHTMAQEEIAAGRMLEDGGLMPLPVGAAVNVVGGKLRVVDGPFVEAKEMVGGFAIFELPDMAAAVASAERFMQLHLDHLPGWDGRCEVRVVAGSSCRPM